jgi:hypothetical protein
VDCRTSQISDRGDHTREIANLRTRAVQPDHGDVRRRLVLAVCAAACLTPAGARAQSAGDQALAEKLFQDGRSLMLAGDYAAGCPKLAESERLDPGVGTLLNLGECYEKQGKTASAWATYREAEPMARRLGQRERAEHAASKAAELASSLAYLNVTVASHPKGLSLTMDGIGVAEAAWTSPIPVDPGPHEVVASAPGRRPWRTEVEVAARGRAALSIPELSRDPMKPAREEGGPAPAAHGTTQRTLGWIGVGVGGAALVTGAVFGYVAKSKDDDAHADGHCTSVDCDATGKALVSDAKDAALVSTIFFSAGAVLTAAGVVLVVTAPGGARIAVGPQGIGGTW